MKRQSTKSEGVVTNPYNKLEFWSIENPEVIIPQSSSSSFTVTRDEERQRWSSKSVQMFLLQLPRTNRPLTPINRTVSNQSNLHRDAVNRNTSINRVTGRRASSSEAIVQKW